MAKSVGIWNFTWKGSPVGLLRLLFSFFLLLSAVGSAQGRPVQTLDGVFVNMAVVKSFLPKSDAKPVSSSVSPSGDIHRLVLRDNQGKIRYFHVGADKSFLPALKEPHKFKGKKVRVRYHVVAMSLGNTPMPSMVEQAVSLEVLQP